MPKSQSGKELTGKYENRNWEDRMQKIQILTQRLGAGKGQEATVRTAHETIDCLQIGKGVHQGCILSPCLFDLYAEYIMRNAGLDEAQTEIKIAREISITLDMQMIPPLYQKAKRK